MKYAVCIVPVAPVRLIADHRQEMTSQYLFGETATILDSTSDGWVKLQDSWDNYTGWSRGNQFFLSEQVIPSGTRYTSGWVNEVIVNGDKMQVPFGSSLSLVDYPLPGLEFSYHGQSSDAADVAFTEKNMRDIAFVFLNTGYVWGGKSVFGIDCSGFVQSVYRMMNIRLLRDANVQAGEGIPIGFLQEATAGDLAFFDDENGMIVHVGILLNDREIIHSSGNVRVDRIDNEGIIHSGTGKRTHRLRTIRRIV